MNPKRRNRLLIIALLVLGVGTAVALALVALNENINLFYSPTQVARGEVPQGHTFRVGGLVADGSVRREGQGLMVSFDVTDGPHRVTVDYTGILPDLFREKQAVIATGRMQGKVFVAEEVLAKHDETYMPKEVADKMAGAHKKYNVETPATPATGESL